MVEDKVSQAIDYGTRQWTPEDDLHSARMGLQRRLDTQRARRNASRQGSAVGGPTRPARPRGSAQLAHITLRYSELLRALPLASADASGVTLTRTADNVYLKLAGPSDAGPTRDRVADLIELELALRDRNNRKVLARRGLVPHRIPATDQRSRAAPSEQSVQPFRARRGLPSRLP